MTGHTGDLGRGHRPRASPAGRSRPQPGLIDGADEITVTLQDNTSLKAKVVGRDETGDIALLQVKSDKALPYVDFGDSDGERVGAVRRRAAHAEDRRRTEPQVR